MNVQFRRGGDLGAPLPDELPELFAGSLLGGLVRHGPILGPAKRFVKHYCWARPNFFTGTRKSVAKRPDPAEVLRACVREWLETQPRGAQSKLAETAGVSNGTLSAFLSGRHDMRLSRVGPIADKIGLAVFSSLHHLGAPSSVTASSYHSASDATEGGAVDGAEANFLEQERDHWKNKYQTLERDIISSLEQYAAHVGAQITVAPRASAGKGGQHRRHDLDLRKRKGR